MDFKTVLKTILIVEMVVSLLVGVFIGVYVSKPIVRDNTIVEVNSKRDQHLNFRKTLLGSGLYRTIRVIKHDQNSG